MSRRYAGYGARRRAKASPSGRSSWPRVSRSPPETSAGQPSVAAPRAPAPDDAHITVEAIAIHAGAAVGSQTGPGHAASPRTQILSGRRQMSRSCTRPGVGHPVRPEPAGRSRRPDYPIPLLIGTGTASSPPRSTPSSPPRPSPSCSHRSRPPGERHRRAVDRKPPPRAAGPDPDRQPATTRARPRRLSRPLQHPPATPLPGPRPARLPQALQPPAEDPAADARGLAG